MINAEKLTFGFNSTFLFQNVTFALEENCHCALIGSNGTGKTTLTNLIREPEQYVFDGKLKLDGVGRITIDGVDYELHEGESIVMPAQHPHAVYGKENFKMLLVVVF